MNIQIQLAFKGEILISDSERRDSYLHSKFLNMDALAYDLIQSVADPSCKSRPWTIFSRNRGSGACISN